MTTINEKDNVLNENDIEEVAAKTMTAAMEDLSPFMKTSIAGTSPVTPQAKPTPTIEVRGPVTQALTAPAASAAPTVQPAIQPPTATVLAHASAKTQRNHRIANGKNNIVNLQMLVEQNDAAFKVEKDAANAHYEGLLKTTKTEIEHTEAVLRSLQERLKQQTDEHEQALQVATENYEDRNNDLQSMIEAEKASLEILEKKVEASEEKKPLKPSELSSLKKKENGKAGAATINQGLTTQAAE